MVQPYFMCNVFTTNEAGDILQFSEEEMNEWRALWKEKNIVFNEFVESKTELKFLKNLKFFVCDSNH